MQFIAIEGIDGSGKSTLHRGWWEEGVYYPGLVQRLKEGGYNTIPSREPGSIHPEDSVRGVINKTYIEIEPHLSRSLNFMGVAYEKTDNEVVRRLLSAAGVVMRQVKVPPELFDYVRSGEASPGLRNAIDDLHSAWRGILDIAEVDPTLFVRLEDRNPRDLIRQALVYAADSATINATVSGFLFLAGHILHGDYLNTLPEDAVVVSDRSADSNRAYGLARGDDPRIWKLYEEYRFDPDFILLTLCPPDVAISRTQKRVKKENKQWADMQEAIHAIYVSMDYPCEVYRVGADQPKEEMVDDAVKATQLFLESCHITV